MAHHKDPLYGGETWTVVMRGGEEGLHLRLGEQIRFEVDDEDKRKRIRLIPEKESNWTEKGGKIYLKKTAPRDHKVMLDRGIAPKKGPKAKDPKDGAKIYKFEVWIKGHDGAAPEKVTCFLVDSLLDPGRSMRIQGPTEHSGHVHIGN